MSACLLLTGSWVLSVFILLYVDVTLQPQLEAVLSSCGAFQAAPHTFPAQSTLSSPRAPAFLCPFLPLLVPTCLVVVVVEGKEERKEEAWMDAQGAAASGLVPGGTLRLSTRGQCACLKEI